MYNLKIVYDSIMDKFFINSPLQQEWGPESFVELLIKWMNLTIKLSKFYETYHHWQGMVVSVKEKKKKKKDWQAAYLDRDDMHRLIFWIIFISTDLLISSCSSKWVQQMLWWFLISDQTPQYRFWSSQTQKEMDLQGTLVCQIMLIRNVVLIW